MAFKKIEINDLHPANPLVDVIDAINENFDILHSALQNVGKVNNESVLQYFETLSDADRQTLLAALTLTEQETPASQEQTQSNSSTAPTGLTSEQASTSAYQIKQDYPDSPDGVYWIQNPDINNGEPFQIYADMTTAGGGWTLVLQNNCNENAWSKEEALLRNPTTPPIQLVAEGSYSTDYSACYSIYGWADKIKRSSSGFEWMIDAYARGRNGGIWSANQAYNFTDTIDQEAYQTQGAIYWGTDPIAGTDGFHQDITEITKFPSGNSTDIGTWEYDNNSIEHRMPWYAGGYNGGYSGVSGNALITTTHDDGGSWWGTLVDFGGFHPAPWIAGNVTGNSVNIAEPAVIWMWVR